jgi:hypothetical protein
MAEIQRLAGKAAEAAAQKRLAERLSRRATEVQ